MPLGIAPGGAFMEPTRAVARRHLLFGIVVAAVAGISLLVAGGEPAAHAAAPPAVREFQPAVPQDAAGYPGYRAGRMSAIAAHPSIPEVAIAAAESGGAFKTTNGGATWTRLDSLPVFRIADLR